MDPFSYWCDSLFFFDSDQLICLEQQQPACCNGGTSSTSSSPSSYVTMDDDRSPSYMMNNCVKSQESMLPERIMSAHFAINDQPLPASPLSISVNNNARKNKSVSGQKILKKPKTAVAKRKFQAVNKCEHHDKKKPRNETISSLPLSNDNNKVGRQMRTGDRIASLQRLVSPFGKSDTASVLADCIEYIRFLHEQVTVLSTTYTTTNAPPTIDQRLQDLDDCFDDQSVLGPETVPASLVSRGLCIVPVSVALRQHSI